MDLVPLTGGDVVAATGGRVVHGRAEQPVGRISIDSRTIAPGEFFVAIRGERVDGHRFVADAFARGADGALVETAAAGDAEAARARDAILIEVADTTRGLQQIARDVLANPVMEDYRVEMID